MIEAITGEPRGTMDRGDRGDRGTMEGRGLAARASRESPRAEDAKFALCSCVVRRACGLAASVWMLESATRLTTRLIGPELRGVMLMGNMIVPATPARPHALIRNGLIC